MQLYIIIIPNLFLAFPHQSRPKQENAPHITVFLFPLSEHQHSMWILNQYIYLLAAPPFPFLSWGGTSGVCLREHTFYVLRSVAPQSSERLQVSMLAASSALVSASPTDDVNV